MNLRRTVLGTVLVLIGSDVRAQSDNRFALGANFSLRALTDESARGHDGIGLLWRFGEGETGWGWHWSLNWYAADIRQSIGGRTVDFGELRVRPIMAGYGYSYRRGRQLFTGNMLGGYAFSSMALTPDATAAYYDRLGVRSLTTTTSNPLVVRPGFSVWHDLSEKVGVNVSIAFLFARPRVTIHSALGEDERRIRADSFQLKLGMAYSIF